MLREPWRRGSLGLVKRAAHSLLGQRVDVIGVLYLVENVNNLFAREGHAAPDSRKPPGLGESLEHDEPRMAVELTEPSGSRCEIDISLVDDHNSAERVKNLTYLILGQRVSRRVVGRAEPCDLGVGVDLGEHRVGVKVEVGVEHRHAVFHIVGLCGHAVHAVAWLDGHHVVDTRAAKDAVNEVDRLVL